MFLKVRCDQQAVPRTAAASTYRRSAASLRAADMMPQMPAAGEGMVQVITRSLHYTAPHGMCYVCVLHAPMCVAMRAGLLNTTVLCL